ncbi:hypothetical protein MCC93_11740 [Morococcus cerebrosus]|uniref:Uncharacterized protein n=1 Tax=Morococcus cerebrosus TaxID=1056807 RepID=A0A0C1E8P0_9NEIS|nr:hypothetical protein MCC93_11740 [Morococcus cerebrosus]
MDLRFGQTRFIRFHFGEAGFSDDLFPIPYPQAPFHLSNPPEKAYNPTFIFEFIIFSDDLRQRKEVV